MARKKLENNPWKHYELVLDPELVTVYEDGSPRHFYPHGKYPTPEMFTLIVDMIWEQNPEGSWPAGTNILSVRWRDPKEQMVRLHILICAADEIVFINVLTSAREKYLDAAETAGTPVEIIQAALTESSALVSEYHHTETLH